MGSRPTQVQIEELVEFLEQNPEIAKGLLRTQHGKQDVKKKWAELATSINALGGVVKDGRGWAKYWAEKKCALKKLCAQHSKSIRRTGGGTEVLHNMSPIELRLVAVMGAQSFASGTSHVAVDPFPDRSIVNEASTSQEIEISNVDIKEEVPCENSSGTQASFQDNVPPIATHHSPRRRRSQSRRLQHSSQLDVEVDRFQKIEERRVEAEMLTARALLDASSGLDKCADAIREGAQLISNAILELARRMPPPQE